MTAGLTAGQSILVNGASGAVGGYAVQLAKEAGAAVTATGDPRSASRLHSYGVDEFIDYTVTPLPLAVAGQRFDVVLNLVRATPGETTQLTELVTDGGTFLSTIPGPVTARDGVRTVQVFVRSDAAELAGLVARADAGHLEIYVSQRRPLADLAAVHHEADAGRLARQDHPDPVTPSGASSTDRLTRPPIPSHAVLHDLPGRRCNDTSR